MNILYISLDDPRQTSMGSQQRNHFLWKALSRLGSVYTVFSKKIGEADVCDEHAKIKSVDVSSPYWVVRKIMWIFRGLTKYGNLPFRSKTYIRSCIGWEDVKFDVVVTRCLGTASRFGAWEIAPLYVDIDDVPTLAFESLLKYQLPSVLQPVGRSLIRWWQGFVVRKCHAVWVVKESDVSELPKGTRWGLLTNIAKKPSAGYGLVARTREKELVTLGYMGYGPNSAGVNWFLNNVWTQFYSKHPDWEYAIAGGGASARDVEMWVTYPGVKVLGFVDDLEDLYSRAAAIVTPIESGAGTCIKVIEAAVFGRKIFATKFAARGLTESQLNRYGIDIFCDAKSFEKLVVRWEVQSFEKKQMQERITFEESNRDYSEERFCQNVESLING